MTPELIWKRTQTHIRETIIMENWNLEDWETTPEEGKILTYLNLEQGMVCPQKYKDLVTIVNSPTMFRCPQDGFIKLNFNGASKGNPGPTGFRGIFRDHQGRTRWVYTDHGGIMSNNEGELTTIHQGLSIPIRNGYNNLEIEGDSKIVIEMLRKLNNGNDLEKLA